MLFRNSPSPARAMGAAALLLAASAGAAAPQGATSPPAGPRLLVVDIDDVGFDLLRDAPTPTLDRLEREGRFFTGFTTAPVCSPTRAMFMSGARPSHPAVLVGGIVPRSARFSLDPAPLVPLPRLLEEHGVSTAKIGKWHLARFIDRDHPRDLGFGRYAGTPSNISRQDESYWRYLQVRDGEAERIDGVYLTSLETDDAIAAVRDGVRFVSLSYHAPHKPLHAPPTELTTIAAPRTPRDKARAMLEALDTELARLLAAALPAGYTVIVFADNGSAVQVGGEKGSMSQASVNCPCWAVGPGVAPGVEPAPVSVVDLYATVAEHFGIAAGADAGDPTRGPHSRSFLAALRGEPLALRWVSSERFRGLGEDPRTSGEQWRRMVRGGRWKLVVDDPEVGDRALFDLREDPEEARNLLEASRLARALGRLGAALAASGARAF